MCTILDASARDDVFSENNRSEAGGLFFDWIDGRGGRLVIGGKLRNELNQNRIFTNWASVAVSAGWIMDIDDLKVGAEASTLSNLKSNDAHVIALARISRARLLYSYDAALNEDFQNNELINGPKGSLYTTQWSNTTRRRIKRLLKNTHARDSFIYGLPPVR